MNLLKEILNFFGCRFYNSHFLSRKGKPDLEIKAKWLGFNCFGTSHYGAFCWSTKMTLYELKNGDYLWYCFKKNNAEEIETFKDPADFLENKKYDKQIKDLFAGAGIRVSEKLED